MRNDTYIPKNIFRNNSPVSLSMPILTLKELYSVYGFLILVSPKLVSYAFMPVEMSKLSMRSHSM